MVTLGFGVKSYISYKMRLRRQRETERDNAFLYDLVDMALPEECRQQSRGTFSHLHIDRRRLVVFTLGLLALI